ncbi:DUF1460 domain-containing protein [Rouxiella sp. Mn2063]|uniref:DUF1460 domain-containing protein n=1 Tax=Rouxiella sp. Mn2063 TaxID=3395262 RepID=UPI003BCFCFBD
MFTAKNMLLLLTLLAAGCSGAKNSVDAAAPQDAILPKLQITHTPSREQNIANISQSFLGTPYRAHTLIGSASTPEKLVVNFDAVDCFTYIDYVQALAQSSDRQSFTENLIKVRYVDGKVSFLNRKHFFTDWAATKTPNAVDITTQVSKHAIAVRKELNLRGNGSEILPGLGITPRVVHYVPSRNINSTVIAKLKTGDYIGIYSKEAGFDVSHVGIFIRNEQGIYFRNASSLAKNMKVVDAEFLTYVRRTPGIVVMRGE